LVLQDIRLPDSNGYEITRRIKEKNPHIAIIAQTAYAYESDQIEASKQSAMIYWLNPSR